MIKGRTFFLSFVDSCFLELSAPISPTSCPLSHVHEIHVFSRKMFIVFFIIHKSLNFSMGNIIALASIGLEWQIIHHMICTKLCELICAPSLTKKNAQ
jgi:hypothetical protein